MSANTVCRHKMQEIDCPYCTTSVCWAIVKHGKGFPRHVAWAKSWLGLDDQPEVRATRHVYDPEGDVNLRRGFTSVRASDASMTDEVSQDAETGEEGLGGEAMGLYHP
jgi:hypothetical protein